MPTRSTENPRLIVALLLAIALGCALWYWLPLTDSAKVPLFGLLGLGALPLAAWLTR